MVWISFQDTWYLTVSPCWSWTAGPSMLVPTSYAAAVVIPGAPVVRACVMMMMSPVVRVCHSWTEHIPASLEWKGPSEHDQSCEYMGSFLD